MKWLLGLLLVLGALSVASWYRRAGQGKAPGAPVRGAHADAGVAGSPAHADRPNLVLISLDTVRPDHLGCYGYAKPTSPNLDRLAAISTRFTNVHCQAPWTLLSHMSLWTSKLPSHNGVDSAETVLSPGIATLPQLLRDAGYDTAAIVNNGYMQAYWGFDRGFSVWREFKAEKSPANVITDDALAWMALHPREPYFLFLHYFDAHAPYACPAANAKAMGPVMGPRETAEYLVSHFSPEAGPVDADRVQQIENAYDGAINFMDSQVGRVLAALPRDTVVIIFSDHGEAFREHGHFGHGSGLYEEETRSVLMVKLPGQQAPQLPRVVNEPVMLMDIAPTLLGLAGMTVPADFEGQDLLPVIHGRAMETRKIPAENRLPIERYAGQSLVLWPWKAVVSNMDGARELYRLPDETNNLAAGGSAVGQSLFGSLESWAQERDYWVICAKGPGALSVDIEPSKGRLTAVIPSEQPTSGEPHDLTQAGRAWTWKPTAGPKTKMLYVQLSVPTAALRIDVHKDGQAAPGELRLGPSRRVADKLPVETNLESEVLRPLADQPAVMDHDGVLAIHYRGARASTQPANVKDLDAETVSRLRSLGYLR